MTVELAARPDRKKGQGAYEKNTLNFNQKLRLVKYLEARKDQLLRDRPRYEAVAADASKELEIEIHDSSVRSAAKAAGIFWKQIQVRRDTGREARHHNKTRDEINMLKRQVQALRTAIKVMCSRLGDSPPVDITGLWPVMTPEDNGATE